MELAHHPAILSHFREGIFWAGLGKYPAVDAILSEWASTLALDVSTVLEPTGRAKAIKNAVGMRSVLFIIDDVWDEETGNLLRCGGPNCAYLLTTRDDRIARHFAGQRGTEKLLELDPAPAFELLRCLAPEVCAAEPALARELVDGVGGLPLAIELLGGYLGDPEHSAIAELRTVALREMFNPTRRLLLAHERLGGRPGERPTLEQTIALSLDDLPPEVVQAFYCLGAFAPKPDTFEIGAAEVVANAETPWLGIMIRRNLLESPDGERLSIHPVVAEYASSRMSPKALLRHRNAYEALLVTQSDKWGILEREYSQIRHAWSLWNDDPHGKVLFAERVQDLQKLRGWWRDRISWGEDALRIAQEHGWNRHIPNLLLALGVAHNDLGMWQKSLAYFERAIPLFESAGARDGLAVTFNNIGTAYSGLGEWSRALEYFERAIEAAEEVGTKQELAKMLSNIARVYERVDKPLAALSYDERALSVFEEIGDREGLGIMLNNIGSVYNSLGELQKALTYYERALTILEELGYQSGQAATLNNIGGIYSALDQFERAIQYYGRALQITEAVGDQSTRAKALYNLGLVHNQLEQWPQSLEYLGRALLAMEELGDRGGVASVLNNIGVVKLCLGRGQQAIEHCQRALRGSEEIGDKEEQARARFIIGLSHYREEHLEEAVEQLRLCVQLSEGVQSSALQDYESILGELEAELAASLDGAA